MPESFFIVSKKNLDIAVDEVTAIVKAYDIHAKINVRSNLVLVQTKTDWRTIQGRATFVKHAGYTVKSMSDLFTEIPWHSTFACRVLNLTGKKIDSPTVEKSMGSTISKYTGARVCLDKPDYTVYKIIHGTELFGISAGTQHIRRPVKPKIHPNQLDWRLSRIMVNLCGLTEGSTVCDPFCGTGTTLLETESMGIHGIGIDFDTHMCEMAGTNLTCNGFSSNVINADFGYISEIIDEVDAIVTDVPYGRNSKVAGRPKDVMYELLQRLEGKRFAIMCKQGFESGLDLDGVKRYEIYRHKSLTRTILVK